MRDCVRYVCVCAASGASKVTYVVVAQIQFLQVRVVPDEAPDQLQFLLPQGLGL